MELSGFTPAEDLAHKLERGNENVYTAYHLRICGEIFVKMVETTTIDSSKTTVDNSLFRANTTIRCQSTTMFTKTDQAEGAIYLQE